MNVSGGVTTDELVRSLERRVVSLPAEVSAFIVLSGCEAMLSGGPRELTSLDHVRISEQGVVSLSGPFGDDEQGARSLHAVLAQLLAAAGPVLPPALARLAEHGPTGGVFSLKALRDELEAALVPLNRNASRRILSRLVRETDAPLLEGADVDAALSSLLDVGEPPANDVPDKRRRLRPLPPAEPEPDLLDGMHFDEVTPHYLGSSGALHGRERRSPSVRPSFAPPAARDSLHDLRARVEHLDSSQAAHSRKLFAGFALIAIAVAGVMIALSLRSEGALESTREPPLALPPAADESRGDVAVQVSQPNAQILYFVGRAPLTVERLPVGVAHEFVALAEGHLPARVLVPAEADWEATAEGARYEVAMQLAEARGEEQPLVLGPSRLGSALGHPSLRQGSVRVVTTPRGARVYQMIGFSPAVEFHDLSLAETHEILVYREGFAPVVRTLSASDFVEQAGRRVAELKVELRPRP